MEKRDYPRVKKLYLISYVNKDKGRSLSPIAMGRTLDISPSGIRLEVYQSLIINSNIEMEIGLQEDKPQRCINLWPKNATLAPYKTIKKRYAVFRTSPYG